MNSSLGSVLIIAEAGVNHNGDLDKAIQLVEAAADAGADIVKFQTFKANKVASRLAQKADYQKQNMSGIDAESSNGNYAADESQLEMLGRLELSAKDHEKLIDRCEQLGIEFFSTGFDDESLDELNALGLNQFKIPSGEITNLPYLRKIASFKKPVILSTGMASLGEIEASITALEESGLHRSRITVLHCTTEYPAPLSEVNLLAMQTLGTAFGVPIGYSDHTEGIEVSLAAVALGATVIEKHFTLDRALPGPDHAASLEPDQLTALVQGIRKIEQALGTAQKRVGLIEGKNISVARKSIVAAQPIAAGAIFADNNITTKRPGSGISPMLWDSVIGRKAKRAFAADEEIEL